MALSQFALSELLDAFRAGDGVDLVREWVRMVMQELIEAEAAERIGSGQALIGHHHLGRTLERRPKPFI